ncbi:hypothetical protein ITJ86_05355 [Winogradskyella sp. F6397]|uniref:Uncharacterized protein n=1 Tax=Winogradskyella marina TaxID=2785530 RepID=A0ABS0EFW3_9FLAO|nr:MULTISPECIES: hypothetical protein [Winogradskyella]MBF8149312.1 hypothetical protein [Winogradskyella marina]
MKLANLIPKTTDAIVLCCVTLLTLCFFIAGLFDVLDYLIVKGILILSFGVLFGLAVMFAIKNKAKENRLEDNPQDGSH